MVRLRNTSSNKAIVCKIILLISIIKFTFITVPEINAITIIPTP